MPADGLPPDEDRLLEVHIDQDEGLIAIERALLSAPAGSLDLIIVD